MKPRRSLGVIKCDNDDDGGRGGGCVSVPSYSFSPRTLTRSSFPFYLYLAPVNYCTCIPIVNDVILSDKDM